MIFDREKTYLTILSKPIDQTLGLIKSRIAELKNDDTYNKVLKFSWVTDVDYSNIRIERNNVFLSFTGSYQSYLNGIISINLLRQDAESTLVKCTLKPRLNALYIFLLCLCVFFTFAITIEILFFRENLWLTVVLGLLFIVVITLKIQYVFHQFKNYLISFLSDINIKFELK